MIEHIAEVVAQIEVNAVLVAASLQCCDDADQGLNRPLKPDDFAREVIDAARQHFVFCFAEELIVNLVDIVFESSDDGLVLVDDLVKHRIENRLRALREQSRVSLETITNVRKIWRLGVPHRDNELWAHEDVQLAELDSLGLIDVARRAQREKKGVSIALKF